MRVLALVLLLLINSFSLPLQAMNSHVMSANIPCNMQTMPEMMPGLTAQQDSSAVHSINICQTSDMSTSSDLTTITQSSCDMSSNGNCSTASSLPFISINELIVASSAQTATVLYSPTSLPEQHPESLYRPPLIDRF